MPNITINPDEVVDLKTPLYKKAGETVYRLLPETTADQTLTASGETVEARLAGLNTAITAAKAQADKGVADAGIAVTKATEARTAATNALNQLAEAAAEIEEAQSAIAQAQSTANQALNKANSISVFQGASATAEGAKGLVPAPAMGAANRFLRSDGEWQVPPNTTYSPATATANGLMSAEDKIELDAAKSAGQIGKIPYLGEVDANSLTTPGTYYVKMTPSDNWNPLEYNWPLAIHDKTLVRVYKANASDNHITQEIYDSTACLVRTGNYGNFNGWTPSYIRKNSTATIYISKSGSDKNLGLDPAYPVLTVNRAVEVTRAFAPALPNFYVNFRFGAGDWGEIDFYAFPYLLYIYPYAGGIYNNYSEDLPKFSKITVSSGSHIRIVNCVIENVHVYYGGVCGFSGGYTKINLLYLSDNAHSYISQASGILDIGATSNQNYIFLITNNSWLIIYGNMSIRLSENITKHSFLYLEKTSSAYISKNISYVGNGFSFTGMKFTFDLSSDFMTNTTVTSLDNLPAILTDMFGTSYSIAYGSRVNGIPRLP